MRRLWQAFGGPCDDIHKRDALCAVRWPSDPYNYVLLEFST